MSTFFTLGVTAEEEAAAPSLYERLGSDAGLTKIVEDTIALHHENRDIAHYFAEVAAILESLRPGVMGTTGS